MQVSTSSASQLYDLSSLLSTSSSSSSTSKASRPPPPPGPPPDSADVSKGGDAMSKLMDLAQSDPDELKAKASDIADALKEKAESATGDEKTALTKMADKFSTLAETGDMSALKPDGPPPSKAASAYAKNSGTSDDTMDEIMSIVSSKLS